MKFLKFLGARCFGSRAAERRFEILKFLSTRHFGSHKQTAEFLKFTSELRNGFGILKFTRTSERLADTAQNFISKCGFKILKFIHKPPHALRHALTRALLRCTSLRADKAKAWCAARLTSQHAHDATEKRRAVKFNHAGGLDSAQRRIARLRTAATRRSYKTARAEKLSKFDLTGALLNFTSRFAMQLCSAVTRRNYEAWRSEIYAVCLHKYPALIRAASGKISRYEVGQATNASLSQGVQRMKFCAQKRHAIKFLKFLGARRFGLQAAVGRGFEILKFMRASARLADAAQNFISQRGLRILKLIRALPRASRRTLPRADKAEAGRAARLTSQHTHDATEKRSAVKINQYLNSAWRRIALCSAAARHGYEAGRAENFSKFDLTGALLNFISLPSHKFKPASIPFLNFILNFTPPASAVKFEHGVKFEGAIKFKKGTQ